MKRIKRLLSRWLRLYRRGSVKITNQKTIWACMHGMGKSKTPPFLNFRIGQCLYWYDGHNRHFYLDVEYSYNLTPEFIKQLTRGDN